ncbi:unnamed protein product [Anisakis simplex]|uniref:Uncharacterized protein n=1 Tax=Anisakis simplex TaxID=6269 RepID=A0A3P6NWK5_ANISI|nr:unnamed protein product [Anisakis simplex]
MSTLAVERIELLEEGQDEVLCETKISSSARRRGVLGTIRRPLRVPKTSPFPRPFVIGLTGGIASGKSNAAKVLAKNGCQVGLMIDLQLKITTQTNLNCNLQSQFKFVFVHVKA